MSNTNAVSKRSPSVKSLINPQRLVVLLVTVGLYLFFSIMSEAFRTYSILILILDNSYYIAFMAIGVTFALITAGVDLSIGAGMMCYSLFGGFLISEYKLPVVVGMLASIALALIFGTINGYIVAALQLPAFIVTLCTMMIVRGLGSVITGGMSVTWPLNVKDGGWFRYIFKIKVGGVFIPIGLLLVIIFAIVMSMILNKTRLGRYVIAVGSNREAAALSGVNVVKYQMSAYVISGLCAGMASIAYSAAFRSSVIPGSGAGLELDAIGAAIIGGTSMTGGEGSISGTLLGVAVMALLKTGLPLIGLQANYQQIMTGGILIIAVFLDTVKNKKRA